MNDEKILTLQQSTIFNNLSRITRTEINDKTKISFSNIDVDYLLDKNNFDFENMNRDAVVQFAFEKRADLKAIKAKIMMDRTDIDIAKRNKYPDLSVRAGYKILPFEVHNAFDFMIGINVPIAPWSWGKYDVDIQKSELIRKSSEQDFEAKRLEIKNQVDTAINSLISLKESMLYYHDILLPQTENSLKSTQYNYENNMTTFLDLLDSYRMYLDAQNMFYESVTMYLKMISDLEKITGMNFKN